MKFSEAVSKAKERFGMPASARVVSCFEAGRDGFWLHRHLRSFGTENEVADAAGIAVAKKQFRCGAATGFTAITRRWCAEEYASGFRFQSNGRGVCSVGETTESLIADCRANARWRRSSTRRLSGRAAVAGFIASGEAEPTKGSQRPSVPPGIIVPASSLADCG
ncbi:MAG: hypothetical protein FJY51_06995 [Betaproteobacteria bacterium]|nr:hypothetical protein [Betaproteobacteria bacterium]